LPQAADHSRLQLFSTASVFAWMPQEIDGVPLAIAPSVTNPYGTRRAARPRLSDASGACNQRFPGSQSADECVTSVGSTRRFKTMSALGSATTLWKSAGRVLLSGNAGSVPHLCESSSTLSHPSAQLLTFGPPTSFRVGT